MIVAVLGARANPPVPAASEGGEPLKTFAGIPPVAYLVDASAAPTSVSKCSSQAGQDPHIFEPTPRQVIALGQARLFFRVGMPFEDRLIEHIAGGPGHFTRRRYRGRNCPAGLEPAPATALTAMTTMTTKARPIPMSGSRRRG